MPGGDRTGPAGYGSRTGRGLGYCSGYDSPGFTKGFSRGRGFGRGYWGRGRHFLWRNDFRAPYYKNDVPISDKEEKIYLEETLKNLEGQIKEIRNRIKELSEEK